MPPRSRPFEIIHNDKDVILVDKPAGLLTVPIRGTQVRSLLALVNEHLASQNAAAFVVHRIDRYTSGLVLFAKHPRARHNLMQQFLAHTPARRYLTIVEGRVEADEGTLEHHMRQGEKGFRQTTKTKPFPGSAPARLSYRVLERLKRVTVLEVSLDTGFKNQIRAQFAEIGHPLVGEQQYVEQKSGKEPLDRQALHAWKLGFKHPVSKRWMEFQATPPRDLLKVLAREGSKIDWKKA